MMPPTAIADKVAAWSNYRRKVDAFRQLATRFRAACLPAIPVKGIVLAPLLYPDPRERPLGDVDLLVRPGDFFRVLRVAKASGWAAFWDSRQLGNVNFVIDGVAVDIASSVGAPGSSAVRVNDLLARASSNTALFGFPCCTLEWHDHVLLMALDAFKDKLGGKPCAREDLVRMAGQPGFDPATLVERADAADLRTMLYIVAGWVTEQPAPMWAQVRELVHRRGVRPGYVRSFALVRQRKGVESRTVALAAVTRAVSDSAVRRCVALTLGVGGYAAYEVRRAVRLRRPQNRGALE